MVKSYTTNRSNTDIDEALFLSHGDDRSATTFFIIAVCCVISFLITSFAGFCVYKIKCNKSTKQQTNLQPPKPQINVPPRESKIQENHSIEGILRQPGKPHAIDAEGVCNNAQDGTIFPTPQHVLQLSAERSDDGDV